MNTTINVPNTYKTNHSNTKNAGATWETIRTVWAFLPLVTTLAWAVYAIPNLPIFVIDYILFPMMIVGWVAAVTYRPLKVLKLVGKLVGKPFLAGLLIPFIPVNLFLAVLFGGAGLCALVALLVFAPAAVTIINYFRGE